MGHLRHLRQIHFSNRLVNGFGHLGMSNPHGSRPGSKYPVQLAVLDTRPEETKGHVERRVGLQ